MAAVEALKLDSDLAEAHTALAHVEFMFDWDWEEADAGFRRALALNPNNAQTLNAYSTATLDLERHGLIA